MNTLPVLLLIAVLILSVTAFAGTGYRSDLYEDFEGVSPPGLPPGWTSVNTNGDQGVWETRAYGGYRGGPVSIRYNQDAFGSGDDWFFTPGISMSSGTAYDLQFMYRTSDSASAQGLGVFLGSAQDPLAMTTAIWNDPVIINAGYLKASASLTVPAAGTYYIGFHAESPPGAARLFVDDVNLLEPEPDLELYIGLTQEVFQTGMLTYDLGDSIECMAYVVNRGSTSHVLNDAFAIGAGGKKTQLEFVITDPMAQTLDCIILYERIVPLEPHHFSALEPDSTSGKFLDLYVWYDFATPGEHTIQAYYRNYADPFGLGAWTGELASDPVVIMIE